MKLQKITTPREEFVYERKEDKKLFVWDWKLGELGLHSADGKHSLKTVDTNFNKLIGKIGITHEWEDGKLVEIPRTAEVMVDDIFEHDEFGVFCFSEVTNCEGLNRLHSSIVWHNGVTDSLVVSFLLRKSKRIGRLDITHEIKASS